MIQDIELEQVYGQLGTAVLDADGKIIKVIIIFITIIMIIILIIISYSQQVSYHHHQKMQKLIVLLYIKCFKILLKY